jgi:hypothetical protein
VNRLDLIDPAALLSGPTTTLKEGNQQLGNLLVDDMVGERAQIRHDQASINSVVLLSYYKMPHS